MNTSNGTLDRPWDAFNAYLFDIDGTLLSCADAVHYFAFCDALSSVAGRPVNLDGVTAHGNTDTGILRDAFARAGVEEMTWRPQLEGICQRMGDFVHRRSDELRVHTMPMVAEILQHLRARGAILGVATGNLASIGRHKLRAAGLLDWFHFAGWSDGLEERADVFARAVTLARRHAGTKASIAVVGDTPADVRSAHANDLPVIAVATGIYSFDLLRAEGPELCLHSLAELAIPA